MANNKTTCPVCMTKMQDIGHDLVCPVCGYKYCGDHKPYTYDDHNHNQYQTYSQKTSYSGNAQPQRPQSSPQAGRTDAPRYQNPPQGSRPSAQGGRSPQNSSQPSGTSSRQPAKPSAGKIIGRIILIYLIFGIMSAFFSLAGEIDFSALSRLFREFL